MTLRPGQKGEASRKTLENAEIPGLFGNRRKIL